VSGPLAEMGRWLEDQGLSADALVPLLRYLRGAGAAPWTGAAVAAPARAVQPDQGRACGWASSCYLAEGSIALAGLAGALFSEIIRV
jgi:hypothetical protein